MTDNPAADAAREMVRALEELTKLCGVRYVPPLPPIPPPKMKKETILRIVRNEPPQPEDEDDGA